MSGNLCHKGGGVQRLMANAILNFNFDFWNPSLRRKKLQCRFVTTFTSTISVFFANIFCQQNPEEVFISAEKKQGINFLKERIIELTNNGLFSGWVSVPHLCSAERASLYREGCVLDEVAKDHEWHLQLKVGNDLLKEYLETSQVEILFDSNTKKIEIGKRL